MGEKGLTPIIVIAAVVGVILVGTGVYFATHSNQAVEISHYVPGASDMASSMPAQSSNPASGGKSSTPTPKASSAAKASPAASGKASSSSAPSSVPASVGPTATPGPTSTPVPSTISVATSCADASMTVNVSSRIYTQPGEEGIWEEVYDTTTNQAMIYAYSGPSSAGSDINITFPPGHAIRGNDIPLVSDGRSYEIRAYAGANTTGNPSFTRLIASKQFGQKCTE